MDEFVTVIFIAVILILMFARTRRAIEWIGSNSEADAYKSCDKELLDGLNIEDLKLIDTTYQDEPNPRRSYRFLQDCQQPNGDIVRFSIVGLPRRRKYHVEQVDILS